MSSRRHHRRRVAHRARRDHYGHGHGAGAAISALHQMERHDRRRERRMRRRHGRRGHGVLFVLIGVLVGIVLVGQIAAVAVEALWPAVPFLAVAVMFVLLLRAGFHRRAVADGMGESEKVPPVVDSAPEPPSGGQAWGRAKVEFAQLRSEYAAYECDPMSVLRRPALADVSVTSTARFVDAFAEAQALDTDTRPGAPHDAQYVAAVERARRAWSAAQDAADRIRLSGLPPAERSSVERVLKLLTTARDSDSEPERLAAYARARSELDRLDRAGVVHLPRTARAALDDASRGALPN